MTSTRTRRARGLLAIPALAATAALVLAGCGARAGDTSTPTESGAAASESCIDTSGDTIKLGFLNSLTGGMAISEQTVSNVLHMAADEINADGGILGKQIEYIQEDGATDWPTFAEKTEKLLTQDCVAAIFGGWTSSSRKAVKPVVEEHNGLFFYPVQYEGLESSKNIFYTGATTNQQIIPALDYLKEQGVTSLFLVGSDYVFPQTANKIIKAYGAANGIEIKGEEYAPLGHTDFATIVSKVRDAGAGAVFNTLNGDSNVAFFKEYRNLGLTPATMPVISVSIAEEEVGGIGLDNIVGQPVAWNYYQTIDSPTNKQFVDAFKAEYGANRVTSDPMEAAYTSLFLWKGMVEKAGSFDVAAVQAAAGGVSYDAPEGTVTVNGENHHIAKTALIGKIGADGLIHTEWTSGMPIEPDPFLKTYPWASGLAS
jgi:urea transport system substrate-binding protein